MAEVDDDPAAVFLNHPHRTAERFSRRLGRVAEHVAQQVLTVHPDQDGFINRDGLALLIGLPDITADQRDMGERVHQRILY